MKRALAVAMAALVSLLAAPASRADTGPYLDIADWASIDQSTVLGPEGVPQVEYASGTYDNPVTVAQWGLQHWSWWLRDGTIPDHDMAVRAADWLLTHQRTDGAWEYDFDFNAHGVRLTAPWISALAQGQAISLLVRINEASGDHRYADAAIRALAPLLRTIAAGGVLADWDGLPWLEEYPGEDAQHVLNGFEFTLIGLYDLAPDSDVAAQLFDEHVASLTARIGVFDAPSAHSQYYAAIGRGRIPSGGGYPRYHAVLTRTLADITGSQPLRDYAARWEGYLTYRPPPRMPPPIVAPLVGVTPSVIVPRTRRRNTCPFAGQALQKRGHISCRRARHVMRNYVRRHRVARGWRCHTGRRAICRRGALRLSAPRLARRLYTR